MNGNFYDSAKWKRTRERALRRDGYMCKRCRRYGRSVPATEVHHVLHLDEYPEYALRLDNLVSLCTSCHNRQHPERARDIVERRAAPHGYPPEYYQ